jgi:hypothetical protein
MVSRLWPEGMMMDNEIIIMAAFLGAGLLSYVIIPGMLVIWDRVLDHMEQTGNGGTNPK